MESVKRNQTFVYIYAICILMVVDGHCGTRINILSNIFPYDSFFMPLFVFSSGYFYRKKPLTDIISSKVKRLLIPYCIYDLVMALFISRITDFFFHTNWHRSISISSIIQAIFDAPTTPVNKPAWFIVMLFWVSITYAIINSAFTSTVFRDHISTLLFCTAGILCIYICTHYTVDEGRRWLVIRFICRILFYIQFYHLGYMFKNHYETILKKQSRYLVCSLCLMMNIVLVLFYGNKLNFYSTYFMKSFNSIILPLVTSITGIIFYYEVTSFLAETIGENRAVSFIGKNTFVILQVHMLFANIPNYYIYHAIQHGSRNYNDFPIDTYMNSIWTRYSQNSNLISFFCGLIGSLFVAYFLDKLSAILKNNPFISH